MSMRGVQNIANGPARVEILASASAPVTGHSTVQCSMVSAPSPFCVDLRAVVVFIAVPPSNPSWAITVPFRNGASTGLFLGLAV
jgi:hypothetical protein